MKSVNAVLSASIAVCLCLATSSQAYDFRQLVNIPKGTAASDFCTKWGDEWCVTIWNILSSQD